MGDRMAVIKAGILQQLGTPGECYDTPDNIFVAQFVGSPPMNLVMAKVDRAGDGLELEFGGSTLQIPASVVAARPALQHTPARTVALGVRSEDMEDASLAAGRRRAASQGQGRPHRSPGLGDRRALHVPGEAVVTEDTKLMAEDHAEGELHIVADDGVRWVASFAPRSRVRIGDDIEIAVDVERAHFFDPETSEAIRT